MFMFLAGNIFKNEFLNGGIGGRRKTFPIELCYGTCIYIYIYRFIRVIRVIRGLSEGYQRVIRGLSEGYYLR